MTEAITYRQSAVEDWPRLPYDEWQDTYATLHMWTQVAGKIRLALAPAVNHWWQTTLYVTACGITTSPMPYGSRIFEITFDFLDHNLRIEINDGTRRSIELRPRTVADFYGEVMSVLESLGLKVKIWSTPVEIPDPIPFEQDTVHASYDPEFAQRFWRVLVETDRVLKEFRGGFLGKASPVHFFWGSFDLAVTRFSGRVAPKHPGAPNVADFITQEAYSHEVSSCGFWPGGYGMDAAYYAYAYPAPDGFGAYPIRPPEAFYSERMKEFFLPYEAVRRSPNPDQTLMSFLETTYEAAAELAKWDRAALERKP